MSIRAYAALAGAAIATAALGSDGNDPAGPDASTYNGTRCASGQIYDATRQSCAPAVVTNDPLAAVSRQGPGPDYEGARCASDQKYNMNKRMCMPGVVTNDARTVVLQGVDPAQVPVPTVAKIPGCTGDEKAGNGQAKVTAKDPFGLCG